MDFIEKLNQKHMLIMYYLLFGETQQRIAEMMNLSERHVSRVVNSPISQEEFERLSNEMRQKIIDTSAKVQQIIDLASPDAARTLIYEMHNADDVRDRIRAANLLLGYSSLVKEKVEVVEKPRGLSEETMKRIRDGLKEPEGEMVKATYINQKEVKEVKEKEIKEEKHVLEHDFSDLH